MESFNIIKDCVIEKSEDKDQSGIKITPELGREGLILRKIDTQSKVSFKTKYQVSMSPTPKDIFFVIGEECNNEKLIKIGTMTGVKQNGIFEFEISGRNFRLSGNTEKTRLTPRDLSSPINVHVKVDLTEKLIIANIHDTQIYYSIRQDIKEIKYCGFCVAKESAHVFPIEIIPEEKLKPKMSPIVYLLTDSEERTKEYAKELEKDFCGSQWGLIVGELNKKPTFALETSATIFKHLALGEMEKERALNKLKNFADIYSNIFPYKIPVDLTLQNTRHTIQSFCTVATREVRQEAAVLIKSLREFHQEPVYIICDSDTEKFLRKENFKNVHFRNEAEKEELESIKNKHFKSLFSDPGIFHKPECIFKKMDVMDFAFENHDNTFFLDADIIVFDSLQENFQSDLVLSPHYYNILEQDEVKKFGTFNAGYVFCADKSFPDFWRRVYLTRSSFFEQQGLDYAYEKYDFETFSPSHNYGFWRRSSLDACKKIKSFHVHILERDFKGEAKLKKANQLTRYILFDYLEKYKNTKMKQYIIRMQQDVWGSSNVIFKKSNSIGKLRLGSQQIFNSHRSGWAYAINALSPLHNEDGVMFDGFLEKEFAWCYEENRREKKNIPYKEPWVGFFHNPINIPKWFFYENSLQETIKKPEFRESLEHCVGLFALSEYHANDLRKMLDKPVSSLVHPTEIPEKIFSFEKYKNNKNKKIVNIGYWLRKLNSIYQLPIEAKDSITKVRLIPYTNYAPKKIIDELIEREAKIYGLTREEKYYQNTVPQDRLSDEEYDEFLSENIVFSDLYDSSANNAVIECIARATPILVNPIPAVKEYLGEDYPLYFDSLEGAAEKIKDLGLIQHAHEHLLRCETRKKLSSEYFLKSIQESDVYKLLK